ncbi:hypothetical protein SMUFR_0324 [Streptococcus mutans UA159-FR]|nr:hypothetical protein SMUFR_0324 [Streptococcus mutans UA159-FR]
MQILKQIKKLKRRRKKMEKELMFEEVTVEELNGINLNDFNNGVIAGAAVVAAGAGLAAVLT